MKLISHRGNLNGKEVESENSTDYILNALKKGYDCEIDLRIHKEQLYLGHDEPQHQIPATFLHDFSKSLWIHCKDSKSFDFCLKNNFHCFWHENDDYVLTSRGFVWVYPGRPLITNKCILVMPEEIDGPDKISSIQPFGVCSDFIEGLSSTDILIC